MLDSTALSSPAKQRHNDRGAAILAACVVFICLSSGLGAVGLLGPDEPRYAWIARAMAETVGFRLNLPAELAARLPSAIAALAATFTIGWLGWKHYRAEEGFRKSPAFLAPLIFSTTVAAIGFSRAATPDMLFSASIALAMASASSVFRGRRALRLTSNAALTARRHEKLAFASFGVFLGLAVLAKGPAAVILAGGAIGLWAIATTQWR